jgi:hypothetical protein
MHKSATKCNETVGKWCKNKHGVSKIMDTLETYHHSIFIWAVAKHGLCASSDRNIKFSCVCLVIKYGDVASKD